MRTMKKGLSWLLTLSLILSLFTGVTLAASDDPATATPEPTAAEAFTFDDGEIDLNGSYGGDLTNLVIPAYYDGEAVTSIASGMLLNNSDVETVVIPSTVTSVGYMAFEYAGNLEELYFYGECPSDLYETNNGIDMDVVIYCKEEHEDSFSDFADWWTVLGTIDDSLADPAYSTNEVTVTAECGSNGTIAPSGKVKVTKGDTQVFTITPAADYAIASFTVDGQDAMAALVTDAETGASTYTLANVQEMHTLRVTFSSTDPVIAAQEGFSFELRDGKAWIKGYLGSGGEITLPTQYKHDGETYDVVGVAASAFNAQNGSVSGVKDGAALSKITKITVPAGIQTIESGAFSKVGSYSGGYHLQSIVFEDPDTVFVHSGSAQAFHLSGNTSLTEVVLPANLTELTSSMFYGCTALERMDIPAGVTVIGQRAFEGCRALKALTFRSTAPAELTAYKSGMTTTYPFEGCTSLTVRVPAAALEAYQTAWAGKLATGVALGGYGEGGSTVIGSIPDFKVYEPGSTTKYIEYHVTSFDNAAKTGAAEVKYVGTNSGSKFNPGGTLTIPETVTAYPAGETFTLTVTGIGKEAMDQTGYSASKYSSSDYWFSAVSFPATLTYIGESGCAGLANITELDLSATALTSIGANAFNGCTKLETVKLPDTLRDLGVKGDLSRPTDGAMSGSDVTIGGVAAGEESNVKPSAPQAPAQVTENVFLGCGSLKQFVVNETNPYFTAIDGVLFTKDGSKLIRYPVGKEQTVYAIPEGTEVIGEGAFMQPAVTQKTGKLETVSFPATLKEIESGAFRQSSLTSVELPANVKFGSYLFDCSKNLTRVTTADGLTEIPEKAFWGCEKLTDVALGASVKTIGASAFERCGFTTIDLTNVTEIGSYAFYYSKLTGVVVPAAAKTGTGAFMNCAALTSATVYGTTLDPYMFFYCTALESLTAPNVTDIKDCALGYCVALTALPLENVTSIGYAAFRNCHGLTDITLPGGLRTMGKYVFADCEHLRSVTFPDTIGVKSLPEGTFYECVNLERVDLGSAISMTEGMAFYCAGWYQGLAVEITSDLPENLFFRNEFEACFIDLGNQQTLNESAESENIGYIWLSTSYGEDGVPVYHFKAKAGGGCGGGCGGGADTDGDGMAEFTMSPSVTLHYTFTGTDNAQTRANLPALLTVYEQTGSTGTATKKSSFSYIALQEKAARNSVQPQLALFSLETDSPITTGTAGYQFMGMKGWAVMAATEYVTLDDLGITLKAGDKLKVSSSDGMSYTVSYEDLTANDSFFPDSRSGSGVKSAENAVKVPAILALTWNSAKIENTNGKTDGDVLDDVAATAYRSTNFRFAHGLSWDSYNKTESCEGMDPDVVCSGYRLLQKVDSITVIHADGSTSGGSVSGGSSSGTKSETVKNADGSTTKTETRADGTTVETTTAPNGSTTTVTTKPDGSVSTVEKRADGTQIKTTQPAGGDITASVSVPKSVGETRVEIPVSKPDSGMVAVIVRADGTEEIVQSSIVTEKGIALRVEGNVELKIIRSAKAFSDMDGHWAKDAVTFVASRELFNGVGDGQFGPNLSMTRGMVNTVLARLAGADTAGGTPWYAKGTAWATENGISDGTNPEQAITREQLATMLYRYAGSPAVSGELSFDDADAISAWARDAVKWCVDNGILNGVGANRMAPQELAQRGQVATMLMRFLNKTV